MFCNRRDETERVMWMMERCHISSAMLSGVLIKSLGIYVLCRIFFNVIGMNPMVSMIFMFLGTVSMVLGGLCAIGQKDIKKLMAYSSVSQMGYIFLGLGIGKTVELFGGAANHHRVVTPEAKLLDVALDGFTRGEAATCEIPVPTDEEVAS